MFVVDNIILIGAVLLLIGIVSSKFSVRLGLPVLVLFVAVGMLAGEEGIGGIAFDNLQIAHAIGTLALAGILFDGGLRTPMAAIRLAWKPAALLATLGVLVTSVITGVAAAYILEIPLLVGVLLGGIVGSTDAAAVFAILRTAGVRLRKRLAATLEIESGSNDPMAIFLTIGLLEVLTGGMSMGADLAWLFAQQMGFGAVVGLGVGALAVRVINRINLGSAGLYPVLTGSFGLLAFGMAAAVGGSGFLAIYLAGIVLGNSHLIFKRGTFLFHDGLAWVGQISMFVVLGLLSSPSALLDVAAEGLMIAAVLILVARPLAVVPLLLPFGYNVREITLVSWVGLKGAVPIILAIFPLLFGLPEGPLLFNVVFFVVLISAVTQGWSLPLVARKLRLESRAQPESAITLEITALRDVDADIVEYTVRPGSNVVGARLDELALPEGVVIAMISRTHDLIPPQGSTRIAAEDHVFIVLRPETREVVDRIFSRDRRSPRRAPHLVQFPMSPAATVADLHEFYGISVDAPGSLTLEALILARLGERVQVNSRLQLGGLILVVRELDGSRVTQLAVGIPAPVLP